MTPQALATSRGPAGPASSLPCGVFRDANEVTEPDFGLFRDTLQRHFGPGLIELLNPHQAMRDPWFSVAHLSLTTLGYTHFGTPISIDPGEAWAYFVNIAVSGTIAARSGTQEMLMSPAAASVAGPGQFPTLPQWNADAVELTLMIERPRLDEELAALLGRPVVKPVEFQLALPLDTPPGQRWMSILSALLQSMGSPSERVHPRHLEFLERSLISGLLLCHTHSYTEQLADAPSQHAPRTALDRVTEEIQRAPDREYTVADLARLAGVSARGLQYAFQDQYGISPMRYLRQVRLDRAHDDLIQAAGTVTQVACHWGFTNPGRFARAYRERFGESPIATLGRRRSD